MNTNMSLCGNLLAASTNDHLIKIWDVALEEDISKKDSNEEPHSYVICLSFLPPLRCFFGPKFGLKCEIGPVCSYLSLSFHPSFFFGYNFTLFFLMRYEISSTYHITTFHHISMILIEKESLKNGQFIRTAH